MEKLDISLYDICEKHAPVKSLKKKLPNPWLTYEIIKLTYKSDFVQTDAMQNSDSELW